MTKSLALITATALSVLSFNATAIAQDAVTKTGHVTLNKRCDTAAQSSCDVSVQAPTCDVIQTCGAGTNDRKVSTDNKKEYVGHVTLIKRTVAPIDIIPGCGPTQYGVPSSSTC